jgi:type I restriction enzyme, S subunit
MNHAQLLEHFERISGAPDAIQRLRRFILDLAVRGKLVEQDPNDEPAMEFLKGVQAEKERWVKEGKIRKDKPLPPIPENALPFELPSGWVLERLGNIGETNIGLTYSPQDISEVGTPVLRSSNIKNGKLDFADLVRVRNKPKESVLVQQGDLLICARNGSRALVGKVAIIEGLKEPAAFGAFMAIYRSKANQYLYHFICSPLFRQMISEVNTTTINQITQSNLRSTIAPIPPLGEQHRIVAKVDELMTLCDKLEVAKAEREGTRDRLVSVSLQRLNQPSDNEDIFRDDARFIFDNLPRLTTRPSHIKQLRQTILNLAVRGKLVPQDPNDEPAGELLKRIQVEKARLVKEGKLRKDKPLPLIAEQDKQYALLKSWCWVRLGDLSNLITDGEHATPGRIAEHEVPLVTAKNVRDGEMDYSITDWVGCETAEKAWHRCRPMVGDILLVCVGATTGRLCILREPRDMVLVRSVALIRPSADMDVDYMALAIRSPFGQSQIWSSVKVTAQPCLYINRINSLLFPLPPLAEQHRIVAKVDELMTICDKLESQLTITERDNRRLLEAVLHEALSPALAEV